MWACVSAHVDVVNFMISQLPVDREAKDNDGATGNT